MPAQQSAFWTRTLPAPWQTTFEEVPRADFLPDVMWPHDMTTGEPTFVDKATAPDDWHRYAAADVPIVTQWDDGRHTGAAPGRQFTSSASMPTLVAHMLADLQVEPGMKVLEIGTGTGWNATLLAHRLGAGNVVTLEVDDAVAHRAREALHHSGHPVDVVTGDGLAGHPQRAPYDRIIATCGLRRIPHAWIQQSRPGGVILAPWGTHYGPAEATARLTVAADGRSASGHFTRPVAFMRARAQRLTWPRHNDYVPGSGPVAKTTTTLDRDLFPQSRLGAAAFAIGLRVPACVHAHAEQQPDGGHPVWFYSLTDRSWAVVTFYDGQPQAPVRHSGPRPLWDEIEAAAAWFLKHDRPEHHRFGLTIDGETEYAWLDAPSTARPMYEIG